MACSQCDELVEKTVRIRYAILCELTKAMELMSYDDVVRGNLRIISEDYRNSDRENLEALKCREMCSKSGVCSAHQEF